MLLGIFLEGKRIQSLHESATAEEGLSIARRLTKETRKHHVCKPLRFEDLTDTEKLQYMESKHRKLKEFKDSIEGTGRSYSSKTEVSYAELQWLVEQAKLANK